MLHPKVVIGILVAAGLLAGTVPPGLAAAPGPETYQRGTNAPQVRIEDSPNDYLVSTTLRWSRPDGATSQEVCTRINDAPDTCQSGISPAVTSYTVVTAARGGTTLGYYVVTRVDRSCTRSSVVKRGVP